MSKLKDTLLMMAVEKETFKIGDKTFQIIEVVEAEQPQPDYSHLVGKWLKFTSLSERGFTQDKWYLADKVDESDGELMFTDDDEWKNGFFKGQTKTYFDLTNPQDTNPDEVKKILVPNEIVISEDVDGLNLHFGNNQALYVYKGADGYGVLSEADREPIQCELIKCERAELKKGDVAFRTDYETLNLTDMTQYCVIIDEHSYCYIDGNDISTRCSKYRNWHKLQPIQ